MNPSSFESDYLASLTPEARDILKAGEGIWESRIFPEDQFIFSEGDATHELYFIVQGRVEITKRVNSDPPVQKLLAVLSEGAVFGEGALLSGGLRSASVKALSEVRVLVLSQTKFEGLVLERPAAAATLLLNLLRIVNQRLISTNNELVMLYDVSQILRDFPNDLPGLVRAVSERLQSVVQVVRGLVTLENPVDHRQQVLAAWGGLSLSVEELEGLERALEGEREWLEGNRLLVPLRNFAGKFWGMFVLETEKPWTAEQRKMVRAVAEPLGLAIEDYYFVQLEAGRSRLQQQKIQF